MSEIAEKIRQFPLLSFFILIFILSWIPFLIYVLIPNEISLIFVIVAVYAPANAALIISYITGEKHNNNNTLFKWVVFVIVWIVATFTFIVMYLFRSSIITSNNIIFFIISAIFLGLFPSLVISSGFSKNTDVRDVFRTYIKPSGHFGYYIFAILLLPLIHLIGIGFTMAFGQAVIWPVSPGFDLFGVIILTFLYTFFFGAGTNEEPGWRGFALPKLQLKFSPFIASVILGIIWGLWHTPIYIFQYDTLIEFFIFLLNTIKISIILTWLYNRTGGSVLATALLHTVGNISFEFIPTTLASEIIQIIVMVVLITIDRMWKKSKKG